MSGFIDVRTRQRHDSGNLREDRKKSRQRWNPCELLATAQNYWLYTIAISSCCVRCRRAPARARMASKRRGQ